MIENERLTARQVKAIRCLLSEPTARAVAAGVGEATLTRWRREPTFEAAYREAREAAFSDGLERLKAATGEAVQTLREVLRDTEAKASERVSAAKAIIEFSMRAVEVIEVETRIRALETRSAL